MTQTIEYEGARHEFPDNFSQSDIASALSTYKAPQQPSVGMDVAKSAGVGLAKGGIGLAGLPGDIAELGARGINAAVQGVGKLTGLNVGPSRQPLAPTYGSEDIQKAIESKTGPFYQPQTGLGKFAQTAGEFAPAVIGGPETLATKLATRVALPAAAATGAEAAGAGPIGQTAAALAAPTALGAVGRRLVTPLPMAAARESAVQALENQGVQLTAGQRTGSRPLQWFEQALGDIPGAGRGATTAAERSAEQFTGAALRQAGENANRATPEVIDRAFNRIGNQFDTLAARNTLHADPQMGQDIRTGINDYHGIVSPPNRAPVIADFEAEIGTQLARNNGTIPGDAFQSITSRLERAARGAPHEVADTLRDMRGALNEAMQRSIARNNPQDLGAWQQVRNQYRNMLVIEKAATGAGENAALGLISPSQLRNATVAQNRRAYARGGGDFAELARSGESVMRPLPQSGTAPRAYAMGLPASIGAVVGGLAGGFPGAALGGLGAIAGPPLIGRALMSRPVQAYLGNQLLPHAAATPLSRRAAHAAILANQTGVLGQLVRP